MQPQGVQLSQVGQPLMSMLLAGVVVAATAAAVGGVVLAGASFNGIGVKDGGAVGFVFGNVAGGVGCAQQMLAATTVTATLPSRRVSMTFLLECVRSSGGSCHTCGRCSGKNFRTIPLSTPVLINPIRPAKTPPQTRVRMSQKPRSLRRRYFRHNAIDWLVNIL